MAPSLSPETVSILKATAPVVKTEGTKITSRMYEIMFAKYPVVKNLFNASHFIKAGDTNTVAPQAQALANAVYAYAANADNLGALGDAVALMAHKHVSFNVLPEHYGIVGECLLAAMKDVLADAATDEIMAGWKEGYEFLADLLIGIEENLKKDNAAKKGGWFGFTKMVVTEKVKETDDVISFILKKPDGSELPDFTPGQYLSFRIPQGVIEGYDHDIVRNYSISCKPGESFYRVSIKRELSNDLLWPDGAASNYFHDQLNVGEEIEVGMPCGTFVLSENGERPVVLIAGGIGLTPMVSMLDHMMANKDDSRKIVFIECSKSEDAHPMREYIDSITDKNKLVSHAFYTSGAAADFQNTKVHHGRIQKECLIEVVPGPVEGNDYYFCGPPSFLGHIRKLLNELKVPASQIKYEYFGPTQQ